jgi:hypothetical protein
VTRVLRFGPLLVPVLIVVVVELARAGGPPRPVPVTSTAPRFDRLEELVAASDVIVMAEAVGARDGRLITDPERPDAGVRTRLVELRPVRTLMGDPGASIVLEEPATLLDGSPVELDGVQAVEIGARGIFFLVGGGSEAAPHHVLVGPQGRFLVEGDHLVPAVDDPLTTRLAAQGGPALATAVAVLAAPPSGALSGSSLPPISGPLATNFRRFPARLS